MALTQEEAVEQYESAAIRLVRGLANRDVVCIVLRVISADEVRILSPGIPPSAFRHVLQTAIAGFEEEVPEERAN